MTTPNSSIRLATNNDKSVWDDYVISKPDASPYHLFAWKNAVEEALGHKGYYLIAEDKNTIQGVLPFFHIKFPLFINELVALPYCDVGHILFNNEGAFKALINEASLLQQKLHTTKTQIRGELKIPEREIGKVFREPYNKVRMFLKLPESSELLFKSFKSKLRSQIRKAEKNGLTFQWNEQEDITEWYSVFSENMRDLGSPVHSKLFFEKIMKFYGGNAKQGLVIYNKIPVGCCIILKISNKVSIPWASTLRKYNKLAPNMLLYWNALKYSADSGCNTFDFGRSTEGEGSYKFKKQWGAKPTPLYWYSFAENNERGSSVENFSYSRKREFFTDIWRKFPLPLANAFGPKVRKYISL